MNPIFIITDGDTRIDILKVFNLVDWTPQTAREKSGVWIDSPLSPGKQLVLKEYDNIQDTLDLQAKSASGKDVLIYNTQELRRLLEKAVQFWTTRWQNEVVYIETRGICETETRYSIIFNYSTPNDDNPFGDPYNSSTLFDEWSLTLEHGEWLENEPTVGVAIETSAEQDYNGTTYGRSATSSNEVYVSSRQNMANITNAYHFDVSLGNWSANLIGAAKPVNLWPAAPAVGDQLYLGCDTSLADSGPFANAVYDITNRFTPGAHQMLMTYYDGAAWQSLGSEDHTRFFARNGVYGAFWKQPDDWATCNLNALLGGAAPNVTGYWVRYTISVGAPAGGIAQQQNRDIYAVPWSFIEIDGDEVGGDIPAKAQIHVHNWSGDNGSTEELYWHRLICGLRSVDRGDEFLAYINLADEQNSARAAVDSVSGASAVTDTTTASGRAYQFPAAAQTEGNIRIEFDATGTVEFAGTYNAFVRLNAISGTANDVNVWLSWAPTSGADAVRITPKRTIEVIDDYQILSFGKITIPPMDLNPDDSWNNFYLYVNFERTQAASINFADLVLIPADEWIGDFQTFSKALSTAIYGNTAATGCYLDIDPITNPKQVVRSLARYDLDDDIYEIYSPIASSFPFLQTGKTQRLWILNVRYVYDFSTDEIRSYAEMCNSIQINRMQRYLGMRGSR